MILHSVQKFIIFPQR